MDEAEQVRRYIAERGVTKCPTRKAVAPMPSKHALTARFAERLRLRERAAQQRATQDGRVLRKGPDAPLGLGV